MFNVADVALKKEDEIISLWKNKEKIIVSVVCITYNHQNYIENSIKSFLMQETGFPFEILIHDDASTDNTVQILKKYALLYPTIIKLILQEENQYKKGNFRPTVYAAGFASGEYVAVCEGDDYWIDKNKLTKQFNAMNNKNADLCFHSSVKVNEQGMFLKSSANYEKPHFSLSELIPEGGGYIPTASWFVRRSVYQTLPKWFFNCIFGDYFFQILAMKRGGAIYLPDAMSAYRVGSEGSLVKSYMQVQKKLNYCIGTFNSLNSLDKELQGEFNKEIMKRRKAILQSHIKFFIKRLEIKALYSLFKSYLNKSVSNK